MFQFHRLFAVAVLAGALSISPIAVAQAKVTADEQAIHDYQLTMPKLQAYAAATHEFRNAGNDPALMAEAKQLQNDNDSMLEKIHIIETRCPHMNAWLKGHGMTARDFLLMPMTLMAVGFAEVGKQQGGKMPAFITEANLKFYEDHKSDIEKLDIQNGSN